MNLGSRNRSCRAVLALVLLGLAGCGGSSSHAPADAGSPAPDAAIDQAGASDGPSADQTSSSSSDGAPDGAADAAADKPSPPDDGPSASDSGADAPPDAASGDAADAGSPIDGGDGRPSSDTGASADAASDGPNCPPEVKHAGWSILGGGFNITGMNANRPSLVVTTTDRPTLAWDENGRIEAVEWVAQDCAFELMGIARIGNDPSLAAAANDRVVMASVQTAGAIVIETFDGANWTRLYGPLPPTGSIGNTQGYTRLVLDAAGLPVVGWIENQFQAAPKLHVARWNAGSSSWVRLTDATGVLGANVRVAQTRNGFFGLPFDIVLGSDDRPIVSWRTTTSGPTVAHYDGTQWVQLGTTLSDTTAFASADVNAPILRVDSAGTSLVAAWSRPNGTATSANVAMYAGAAWVPLGGALKTAAGSTLEYGMALDGMGVPVVASVEMLSTTGNGQQIFTYRYNGGTSWLPLAQPLDDADPASFVTWPSIIVDHAGRWVVSWVAAPLNVAVRSVYLARFTPNI